MKEQSSYSHPIGYPWVDGKKVLENLSFMLTWKQNPNLNIFTAQKVDEHGYKIALYKHSQSLM